MPIAPLVVVRGVEVRWLPMESVQDVPMEGESLHSLHVSLSLHSDAHGVIVTSRQARVPMVLHPLRDVPIAPLESVHGVMERTSKQLRPLPPILPTIINQPDRIIK